MYIAQLGAPVDTASVVAVVKDFVQGGIPWLDPRVTDWLAQLLLGLPIVPLILGWKAIGSWVRSASPWVNEHIGKKLEKFAFIINPILAGLIAGGIWGDSTIGLAATAAWSMIESAMKAFGAPKAPSALGVIKGRASAALLALGLLSALTMLPGQASASGSALGFSTTGGLAEPEQKFSFSERVAISTGIGGRCDFRPGERRTIGLVGVQVGVLWNNHLNPRIRATRDLEQAPKGAVEVGLWYVW